MRNGRPGVEGKPVLKPTDIGAPEYFHKVVDLPMACPPYSSPEYIRLIARAFRRRLHGHWHSNFFRESSTHLRPPFASLPAARARRGKYGEKPTLSQSAA